MSGTHPPLALTRRAFSIGIATIIEMIRYAVGFGVACRTIAIPGFQVSLTA
jgi:hypothetical protein